MKRFFCLLLMVSLLVCGCEDGGSQKADSLNQAYVKAIKDAAEKLKSTYTDYVVVTSVEAPDGKFEYLECQHEGDNYTEYSVDENNELGTVSYGSAETITYSLMDWLTADGKYYIFGEDNSGNGQVYSVPEGYSEVLDDRCFLYVNDLLAGAISVEPYKDLTMNFGSGDEVFKCYKLRVSSETLKPIIGAGSYSLYKSINDSQADGTSIKKLTDYYLEDLEINLTFSDATVIVGIDNNNILKYMYLEVGGLGTRMYMAKAVVATSNSNLREMPDVSGVVPYEDSLRDFADYVATFDSYEDALEAMNVEEVQNETEN